MEKEDNAQKFSQQQYEILKSCSAKKDMTEWNTWRRVHPREEILLQEANLREAHLENAHLVEAHLEKADFWEANLKNADLGKSHLEFANFQLATLEMAHLPFAELEYANLEFAELKFAELGYAELEYANLGFAHLEHTHLWEANLQNANFHKADLPDADFHRANLQGADLREANLQGAKFDHTSLEGASFVNAIVDGHTLFVECELDCKTDFRRVGLDSTRIGPATKQLLEYNARRMNWEEWYKDHWLLQWPVKLFWSFSDYGISTWRIIGWFFLLALAFAAIYANCACWWPPGIVNNLDVEPHLPLWHYFLLALLRPVYFSIVTMTTLGFGDMYANETSILGHALLTFQVILGYVLLGALVTRFAVLFTAGGPAGKFAPTKTKETAENEKEKA